MKKVTNKMMSALCMTSILFSVGCTGNQETKKESVEQKVADTEIGKEKVIQDKKMKVTAAKIIKDEKVGEQEKLVQVKFDIKNEGKEDFGVGAGDFLIKDKEGKTYTMYGREDNVGDVIAAGKSLEGNGYYRIAKDAKELKVVYSTAVKQDTNEKTIEWKIGNPNK